jgi:SAM-dependent methyltransferase
MKTYHAFISYNSTNRDVARTIRDYLANSGLRVFLDDVDLLPGQKFQETLESALQNSASILVIIGPHGVGPWQTEENYEFQLLKINKKGKKAIIPVILPGAAFGPDVRDIPLFLTRYSTFIFSKSVDDKDDLFRLMRAIPRTADECGPLERPFLREEQDRLLDRTTDFYDREANLYYDRWKNALPLPPMYAFLEHLNRLSGKPKILDAGCGPGHHAIWFASQGCCVDGLDASASMIRIAGQNAIDETSFRVADMRDLQIVFGARNLFDGIWACASCLHITKEGLGNQLYEFLAVLRPSGVLALSMQVGAPSAIQDDGRFFERYEENELEEKLSRYGFNIVNINTQITDRNTLQKRQVKKWMNITAIAPRAKERIDILDNVPRATG